MTINEYYDRLINAKQDDLDEIRSELGQPVMWFDFTGVCIDVFAVYAESVCGECITYRVYSGSSDPDDSFTCKVPVWAGWDRTVWLIKFAIANDCDWDESDDYWVSTFERLRVHNCYENVAKLAA